MGALCSNGNKVVVINATIPKTSLKQAGLAGKRAEPDITDKDKVQSSAQKRKMALRPNEKLWCAVEANDITAAELFLDFNEINESELYDPFGQTMLHMAAGLGHAEMLMMLIERTGAKPDMVNNSLATPLHLACRSNRQSVVKFLIGCGVDVNIQDEHGQTPLLLCAIHAHTEIMHMIVEASIGGNLPDPLEIDLANHQGLTALNCAAIKGDLEMVKCLVGRGNAQVDKTSPKGCTALIYAGRGGFPRVVEFLLKKKASALKQDNAGGTVLHHAIEKGHLQVIEQMITLGVDIYSAIEIADNSGRTPLFEAVENLNDVGVEVENQIQIICMLCKPRAQGGFGANPNVVNYNGQTPLFIAARQGSLATCKVLVNFGAKPDLNNGELVKPEDDIEDDEAETVQEQLFMEAFKNCMTPVQLACVLGFDDIVEYLVMVAQADPNLQTKVKGYTTVHLCVLANKPEIIIDLLQRFGAFPMLEDRQGRALLELVYQYMPSYLETFQTILEKMSVGITNVDHLNIVEDDRQIQGVQNQEEINQLYVKEAEVEAQQNLNSLTIEDCTENDLLAEGAGVADQRVEIAFGGKIALCLVSSNWQYKEYAMKQALRSTEKFIQKSEITAQNVNKTLAEIVDGALAAVSLTCRDKIIKVFNLSLQLFNIVIQSTRVERDPKSVQVLCKAMKDELLIQKFLLHSEQSNTRVTNKIHEALLDLAYQSHLGEDVVANAVYEQIRRLTGGTNHKGLLAQLALLYKLVNTFTVHKSQGSSSEQEQGHALTWYLILEVVLPSVCHSKDDIRNASVKIIVDVQRKTGLVTYNDLDELPDKVRESVWEKLSKTELTDSPIKEPKKKLNIVNLEVPEMVNGQTASTKLTHAQLDSYKQLLQQKGSHKDWTQREIALNTLSECFNQDVAETLQKEEDFLQQCSILLQTSLDENNIQIYLIAVEVVLLYIQKMSLSEAVYDALPSLLQSIILRTTDTNTRVRKRSVEVINQVWELPLNKKASQASCQMIAQVLTDPALNEKAIIGRLGLFIKKAILIESSQDINKKPLQLILGKDYEQLAQFACQWCLHKNTKVRQCALKLATEICRLNCIDPRGSPFKQRIVNFVLGLRSSIRDPLVKKINEVCTLANPAEGSYIDSQEIELGLAQKSNKPASQNGTRTAALPSIANKESLPSVSTAVQGVKPTIVLPHSEPLSEAQLEQAASLVELFGSQLITCFYSQTWSSRQAAFMKVLEQMPNLDPNCRDAMSAEINTNNLPPEVSFKTLLKLCEEGLKDPVLKNYITVLELIQTAMPLYFKYLHQAQIKRELTPLVIVVLQKTSDLKQKIREASLNFCLWLSHQEQIGTESMLSQVCTELDTLQWEKQQNSVQSTFGNSNMIVSCLNLLSQFQQQTKLVCSTESKYFAQFVDYLNRALKHSNPQVRKQGEQLFKIMYTGFGDDVVKRLRDQKQSIVTKLVQESTLNSDKNERAAPAIESKEFNEINEINESGLDLSQVSIQMLLKGNEDFLRQLKLPNPKKRLIAIIEIKKVIQQKLTQLNAKTALDLVEPLSQLLRHLLRDENQEVYMESLALLKFIVGNLAQHLSALDLHLMMGQFIQVLVSGQENIRTRVASDKVIVYFSKHTNIGSMVVAKEVLKNIERLNKQVFVTLLPGQVDESLEEKKVIFARFYSLLQMLLQQFSIVLCYQPDFYSKCLELIADTMSKSGDEPQLKSSCTQLVVSLHQLDSKLLDQGVQQLDFTKKTHLKKIIIELENSSQKGFVNQNLVGKGGSQRSGSPDVSFRDTQQSFTSLNSRNTLMSPGLNMNRRLSRDRRSEVRTSKENQTITQQAQTSSGQDSWVPKILNQALDQNQTAGAGWLEKRNQESSVLPVIDGAQTSRRRQLGQGFVGGASNKAAGFNSKNFNMTGDYSNARKAPVLGVQNQELTVNGGVGSNLLNAPKKTENEDKMPNVPLYVPTQRQNSLAKKSTEGYQPSLLGRMNSKENPAQAQETTHVLERSSNNQWGAGLTGSSFGSAAMRNQQSDSRSRHQLY